MAELGQEKEAAQSLGLFLPMLSMSSSTSRFSNALAGQRFDCGPGEQVRSRELSARYRIDFDEYTFEHETDESPAPLMLELVVHDMKPKAMVVSFEVTK